VHKILLKKFGRNENATIFAARKENKAILKTIF
jgi:hypothetical protein